MTRWNFNPLITLSASRRQQTLWHTSWWCHPSWRGTSNSFRTSFFLFSALVSYEGFGLHLRIRWRMRVTARFTTRTSLPSRSSLGNVTWNRQQVAAAHIQVYHFTSRDVQDEPATLSKSSATTTPNPRPLTTNRHQICFVAFNNLIL